jgi:predicted RNase H-like nuclease
MPTYIGIDGFRGGWVAVYVGQKGGQRFDYSNQLHQLLSVPHSRAMIDVPIGLPEQGYRQCDLAAKKLVGSSVFLGARWKVWTFRTYEDANVYYRSVGDKGIAKQLWCIRDKLQEVNEAMTPQSQIRLHETHPELIFWRLNGMAHLNKKKSTAGRLERIALLQAYGFDKINIWLEQRHGTGIGRDDLIDACACALAARDSKQRIPSDSPPLARDIRMEMWF